MQKGDCIHLLLQSLQLQSEKIGDAMLEIQDLISNQKYRQVFLVMNNLKETGVWIPSNEDEKNLEIFWWEYAN